MCGRYALALRPGEVRRSLEDSNMPSQSVPDDDEARQAYNFAPGYYGLVYRAEAPAPSDGPDEQTIANDAKAVEANDEVSQANEHMQPKPSTSSSSLTYKIQAMKWGLVPSFTKSPSTSPASYMKTINCRSDSLARAGGLWQGPKQKKRCVVLAQGFYEWLKHPSSNQKTPHYVRRKDGQLMCFAGLWDRAVLQGKESLKTAENGESKEAIKDLWTYTIITADSNKQLSFLHDRMPVILENGTKDMFTWLDPSRNEWSAELQQILKPFEGELDCYPVTREVGKVGNESPRFVVPLEENKQSINNFFNHQKASCFKGGQPKSTAQISEKPDEHRSIGKDSNSETNAPMPAAGIRRGQSNGNTKHGLSDPAPSSQESSQPDSKRLKADDSTSNSAQTTNKGQHPETSRPIDPPRSSPKKPPSSPAKPKNTKQKPKSSPQKSSQGSPKAGDGSMKITNFFSQ